MAKKYIIFGAGITGEKFLYQVYDKLEIAGFFDNRKEGALHGYKIQKPYYKEDLFVIVALDKYVEVRSQLLKLGYKEFENFIPYQIYNKKMAISYGNCHMAVIKNYMELCKKFAVEYGFYPFPQIQEMPKDFDFENILPHCKLFLHQSIRKENKFGLKYASSNLMRSLPKECRIVSAPNLYGMPKCFFPQLEKSKDSFEGQLRFLPYYEKNVWRWLEEGKTEEEILRYMVVGGIYEKEEILKGWEEFCKKLTEREVEWDIKISDYIFANYKTRKLFYEPFHISSVLAREIAKRVLEYLGYDFFISYTAFPLDELEVFIYRDVKNALELEFEETSVRIHSRGMNLESYDMSVEEYVRQLCRWIRLLKQEREHE